MERKQEQKGKKKSTNLNEKKMKPLENLRNITSMNQYWTKSYA
jgi:hypothetical protein